MVVHPNPLLPVLHFISTFPLYCVRLFLFFSTATARKHVCKDMEASRYFKPTKHTLMVHMWTHVYLGMSRIVIQYVYVLCYNVSLCNCYATIEIINSK